MYKKHFMVLLFFLIFMIAFAKSSISQDSNNVKLSEVNPMKKGSWAIVFEAGTIFGGSYGYNNPIIEEYNFLVKYHLSEKTALRFNISIDEGDYNENYLYNIKDCSSYGIQANVNMQMFFTKKYFAKPFISIGPYFYQNYYKETSWYSGEYKNNAWDLGVIMTFGAELFVYKGIGIVGEYIIKGSYGKRYNSGSKYETTPEKETEVYKLRANTSRFGFTFYF
jgi:hypothetical protein